MFDQPKSARSNTCFDNDEDLSSNSCRVWAAVAAGSAAVISGAMSSDAAQSAANTQAQAGMAASNNTLTETRETNAMLQNQFNQNQQNQAPWLQTGDTALAALQSGMGLGNPYSGYTGPQSVTGAYSNPNGTSTGINSNGTTNVGSNPASQNGVFVNSNGQSVDANGNPVTAAPTTTNYGATNAQMGQAANAYSGQFQQTFTPSDLYTDPSYQWRLNQGNLALNSSAAAQGLTGSGQNLKDIVNYNQGAASTEYQAAYDRFMNNQNTAYNRLAGLAGVGQTAATNLGQAGASTAGNIANTTMSGVGASNNYLTGAAAANAAGQVGSANAVTGAIGNGLNTWMGLQYLNRNNNGTGLSYNPGPGYGLYAAGNATQAPAYSDPTITP